MSHPDRSNLERKREETKRLHARLDLRGRNVERRAQAIEMDGLTDERGAIIRPRVQIRPRTRHLELGA